MSPARRRIGALLLGALTVGVITGCTSGATAQTALLIPRAGWPAHQPAPTSAPTSSSSSGPASAASAPTPTPLPTVAPVVVSIGDSIMAGYGLEQGQDWPTLMGRHSGVGVTNLACSGAGFIAVGACGTDFAGLVDSATQVAPTIVIVEGSDNDADQTDTAIESATTATVTAIHDAIPNALIVGLSTLWDPSGDEPHEIAASSDAVRQAVTAVGGVYVDIGQPLQGGSGLLQADDEHPTAAGQKVLLQAVTAALARAGVDI